MDDEQSVVTNIRKENWFYTTTVACLTGQLFGVTRGCGLCRHHYFESLINSVKERKKVEKYDCVYITALRLVLE